jgi:hypothetical protein
MKSIKFKGKRTDNGEHVEGTGYYKGVMTDEPLCLGDARICHVIISDGTYYHIDQESIEIIYPTVLVVEDLTDNGTVWGISFDGNNPDADDYFTMGKDTAFRLSKYLNNICNKIETAKKKINKTRYLRMPCM